MHPLIIAAFHFVETAYTFYFEACWRSAFEALRSIPTLRHTRATSASIHPPPSPFFSTAARNCMRLQVLELDHVSEINQEVAAEVCREGLKGLEMFVLTSTPVTPKALLHFNSEYRVSALHLTHEEEETVPLTVVALCQMYAGTDTWILPLV